jgi:hypothetical protein
LNWYGIMALRTLGLAWDIQLPAHKPARKARVVIPAETAKVNGLLTTISGD